MSRVPRMGELTAARHLFLGNGPYLYRDTLAECARVRANPVGSLHQRLEFGIRKARVCNGDRDGEPIAVGTVELHLTCHAGIAGAESSGCCNSLKRGRKTCGISHRGKLLGIRSASRTAYLLGIGEIERDLTVRGFHMTFSSTTTRCGRRYIDRVHGHL